MTKVPVYEEMSERDFSDLTVRLLSKGNYGEFKEACEARGINPEFEQEKYAYLIAEREFSHREEEFLQREAEEVIRSDLEHMTKRALAGLGLVTLITALKERGYSNGFDPGRDCKTEKARREAYAKVLYNLIHEEKVLA